jgi:hypothetical protein
MNDAMLACRPDYLIYPERNTKLERAEHVRLFNNDSQPLPLLQDWRNTFKNKHTLITDTTMWFADKNHIIDALKRLQEVKKVSFLEPIWLQKIIYDKDNILDILDHITVCLFANAERNEKYVDCIKYVNDCAKKIRTYSNFDMSVDIMIFSIWEELNENSNRC